MKEDQAPSSEIEIDKNSNVKLGGYAQYTSVRIVYGLVVIWVGFASALFHASLSEVGATLDGISMLMFAIFIVVYSLSQLFRFQPKIFCGLGLILLTITITLAQLNAIPFDFLFGITLGLGVLSQLLVPITQKYTPNYLYYLTRNKMEYLIAMQWKYLILAITSFGLGFLLWNLENEKIVCYPTSWFQFHAVWHFLTATAMGLAYFFIINEQQIPIRTQ